MLTIPSNRIPGVTDDRRSATGAGTSGDVGRRPRQRRAVETRQRLYEAAVAEYERVGIDAARVEDIVDAAGVSWSTFFDYFPRKEDVLQEAGVGMARSMDESVDAGLAAAEPVVEVFTASLEAVADAAPGLEVWRALVRDIVSNPGRMTAHLADRGLPSWTDSTTRLLQAGQQRGEITRDYPARALAAVLLQAWAISLNPEGAGGRPPGDWKGPARSLGELAVEVCFAGMRPMPDEGNAECRSEPEDG
jgi:AcrR family transcriptional regulator